MSGTCNFDVGGRRRVDHRLHLPMRRGAGKRAAALLLCLLMALPIGGAALAADDSTERTETVYVTADANGKVTSILSSVYLTNPDGRGALTDASTLTNVKNLLSNELPENADGVWSIPAPEGKDVCYQGDAPEELLPVTMRVTYALDGVTMSPAEIAGKSGHVKVTFRYVNRQKSTQKIGNEDIQLYTPFTVVTMVTLDDAFRSVTVQDARLMTDAGSTTVLGTTFPGLAANLEKDAEGNLADGFSFEADVDVFTMESATAIILPDVMSADSLKSVDDLRDFADGMDELNDAGNKLLSGARSLSRGANSFAAGLKEFFSNLSSVSTGIADATGGASQLLSGISQSVSGAASTLAGMSTEGMTDGQIATITGVIGALNGIDSGLISQLSGALSGISTLSGSLTQLSDGGASLQKGADSVSSGARRLYRGIREFCNDGLQDLADETGELAITADRKDAMLALCEAYNAYSATEEVASGSVKIMMTTDAIYVPRVEKTEAPTGDTAAPAKLETPARSDAVLTDVADRLGDWFSKMFTIIRDGVQSLFQK